MESIKTIVLLTLMTLLMVWVGGIFGGVDGMLIALLIAAVMNFFSYFYSDKLVLAQYNAVEVDEHSAPGLIEIVHRLANKAGIPMPKVYIVPEPIPNAFATGRNPSHAAVAVTEGLLDLLDEEEIEAVLAHELSHVRHYDILIGTIAATIAGAIAWIANIMQFGAFFGGGREEENTPNPIIMILLSIILPIAAGIIQMAVSRSREFMADEGAARITGHPEWLQSALIKLENYNAQGLLPEATPETAHMFIVNPFTGKDISFASLFRTHPTTEQRIERLEEIKREMMYR
ncbi:zinc metalloprotease HtpX [Hydrogenimonas thermophila]|uniref:zinc metalloprotease HtpX n=1 Tax=Hydrogenimonas thermophila TaxID=223786 RepID=UPI0029373C71|nr:zinc metalloprotease HtpX [Hydrogenimonas thermophila]WOE69495.1 zinc metalloprotease HtpX [Hydrogenimonas thermophila]WOE72006.1 zinc metalloprotease HtpX [Hydrogenimonas thermophila]